ncbi:MAG: hypothetical protein ACE141_10925 [Bryobacteraceae bacterium]
MTRPVSRRQWFRNVTAGMTGLLASERLVCGAQVPTPASRVLIDPRPAIKITRIEIIPVDTLRTMNPDFIDGIVEKVAAIREVVGPKFDLGIELDDNLIENERNAPEWEFPARSDSFDGSVLDH